jgi:hypothetical protein
MKRDVLARRSSDQQEASQSEELAEKWLHSQRRASESKREFVA